VAIRPKLLLVLKILGVLILALTLWRCSLPSLRTSAEAVNSYNRKMNELEQAHKSGVPARVRISAIELNSDLEDWYRRMHVDVGWPPWGTVFYFRGDRAHACIPVYAPGNLGIIVVDAELSLRGNALYPRSMTFWFGIVPVPGSVVAWTANRFFSVGTPPPWEDPLLLWPDYVTSVQVETGELVLETH